MKQLIKVQATINKIEEITHEVQYHSQFDYINNDRMRVKTYCIEHLMNLVSILNHGIDYTIYINDNTSFDVLDLSEE